jgi:hypothetical protein
MWLACKLGLPLQHVKEATSSSEYLRWMQYRVEEPNHFHREDHYFAQLCFEIFRSRLGYKDRGLTYTAFLKKFEPVKREARDNAPPTPEELDKRTLRSKSAWCGWLRVKVTK